MWSRGFLEAPFVFSRKPWGVTKVFGRRSAPYLFLSPFFACALIFSLFPIGFSFVLSLTDWDGLGVPQFVGLGNYTRLLQDSSFYNAFANTVILLGLALPVQLALSLALAYWLHMGLIRFKHVYQAIWFLPYITTPIAVGLLFSTLLDYQYGLVNSGLMALGLIGEPVPWLVAPQYGKPIIAAIIDWKFVGYSTVFLLAGMKNISSEIYEAAEVDGATVSVRFWYITLPLLSSVMTFVIVTGMINIFQVFDEPYALYAAANGFSAQTAAAFGGPAQTGMTLVMYLYQAAYKFHQWGYAAAIGYLLALIMLVFVLVTLSLLRRWGQV